MAEVKCPLCGGMVLAEQESSEYWSFTVRGGVVELVDLVSSVAAGEMRYQCDDCLVPMRITGDTIVPIKKGEES